MTVTSPVAALPVRWQSPSFGLRRIGANRTLALAGSLLRYRGTFVTLVTCGLLAVYPDDITTAHTLILEPWMNLACLIGV